MTNKEELDRLWKHRENLANSIRIRRLELAKLRTEFEYSLKPQTDHLNKLTNRMGEVMSDLHNLGIPAEDC